MLALKSEIEQEVRIEARILRYIIAEIITKEYGETERIRYLVGLFTGKIE